MRREEMAMLNCAMINILGALFRKIGRLLQLITFTWLLGMASTAQGDTWDVVSGSFTIIELATTPVPLHTGNPGTLVDGTFSAPGTIVAPFEFMGGHTNIYTSYYGVPGGCGFRPNIGPSIADLCSWTFSWNGGDSTSQGGVAKRIDNSDGTITLVWTSPFSSGPFSGMTGSWTLQLKPAGASPDPISRRLRDDFDGDGNSDILWRNIETGGNQIWTMNGSLQRSAGSIDAVSQRSWQVAGSGDFDGNGKAEILWRNVTTGGNVVWQMNGATHVSSSRLSAVGDRNWKVVGIGDFNDDGKDDILWRHARTGKVIIWQMDGSSFTAASVGGVSDRQWRVVGTGDFNGDGKSDILWRHSKTGGNVIWHMDGFTQLSAKQIPSVGDTRWAIAGIGDFDGDGKSDILWRQLFTGGNVIWQMNGFSVTSATRIPGVVDTNWQIAGVGDYDGNGKSEILWRHMTTGGNLIWEMDGTTLLGSGRIGNVGNRNWRLVGNGHPPWVSIYTVSGNTQTEAAMIIEVGTETLVPFGPKDSNGDLTGLSGFHLNIDGEGMTVWLSTQGLPSVITTGGTMFHFKNYTQNTVDITAFEANGTVTNYPSTRVDPILLARAVSANTSSSSSAF